MTDPLTLMAVHAHPDDEVIGTGGVLARYSAEGVHTVLVTCTNGEQGDLPGGIKPEHDGHDEARVVQLRRAELERSCSILGVGSLELLGYRDSGMDGWEANGHPEAFSNVSLDDATARLVQLMERHRPQVVVTYDENGNYGHPDHIQAHRVAVAAAEASGIPEKLYYTAIPRSSLSRFAEGLAAAGVDPTEFDLPEFITDEALEFGTPDELITTAVDVGGFIGVKREALLVHASQAADMFLLRLPEEAWRLAFSTESFVLRGAAREPSAPVENDLFSGLR